MRWPLRVRLTAAFAVVMTAALALVGAITYQRIAAGLRDDLDRELLQRAQDLLGPVSSAPASQSLEQLAGTGLIERGESFAEVQTPDGIVLAATETLRRSPLLDPAEARRASRQRLFVDRPFVPGLDEPARLLAVPVVRRGAHAVLVVGATRENGREVLRRVRTQGLVGLPLLLLLSTAAAYVVAGAALRPVESMRQRAAGLSAGRAGQRLPVPPGDDELTRLGATLNDLLARVDAARARERAFVAGASHELRTPLALLRIELELAVRRPRPEVELRRAINSAAEEVERLTRLADALLLLAGEDRGDLTPQPRLVRLNDVLAAVARRFTPLAETCGRRVSATGGDEPLLVEADPDQLTQALDNLVQNALDHGRGDVELHCARADGAVEVHVLDHGDGLAPELDGRAFDRFTRWGPGSGSGLGLSVVASVARAHGGSAAARTSPGGGADVWLRLPSRAAIAGEQPAHRA